MGKKNIFVVGIGASAGGLEALSKFFAHMPKNDLMSFVVIQHLSPDYKSLMPELLGKKTNLTVQQIKDDMEIERNNIYLIPPKKNIEIEGNRLKLIDYIPHKGLNLPIDLFFESLAHEHKEKSIAIILSGTGSDGSVGIRAIKEQGGMVMVQNPFSAKFDGMPRNAISTGIVDFVLDIEEMPKKIMKYLNHPYISDDSPEHINYENEDTITKILRIIRHETELDFSDYKRNTIIRRIQKRMSVKGIKDIEDYERYIYSHPSEAKVLHRELLIGVTKFFRDKEIFSKLEEKFLPDIISHKKNKNEIRVWIAGCSTGQEAYTIAIIIKDYLKKKENYAEVKIFATDIHESSLKIASKGEYKESSVVEVPKEYLAKYFNQEDGVYKIKKEIREMIVFAKHDLIKDPPFYKIDLITCRNVLIYFNSDLQKRLISLFNFSLNDDGYLFLGKSETIGDLNQLFDLKDKKAKIYKSKGRKKNYGLSSMVIPNLEQKPITIREKSKSVSNESRENINIYKLLIEKHVSPCIIVNDKQEIVHVYGNVGKFFEFAPGQINFSLNNLLNEELEAIIGSALHKLKSGNKNKEYRYLDRKTVIDGKKVFFNLKISKLNKKDRYKNYYEIIFEEKEKNKQKIEDPENIEYDNNNDGRVQDLEEELSYTKETLQSTVEELETSNEELQATNEELMASNEELQSTNEELQSVNEELITVNSEHQSKIEELEDLNDDINNLLRSTDIGTIFVDENLSIRKFTPKTTKEINLIEKDIGRPLEHISHNLKNPKLLEDAKKVLEDLTTVEREVENKKGETYLKRTLPFRTKKDKIEGVVITFINITSQKDITKKLDLERKKLTKIIDDSPIGICITDEKGIFEKVNESYCKIYDYNPEELIGNHFTLVVPDEHKDELTKLHDDFIEQKMELTGEWKVKRKDGKIIDIIAEATYIDWEDGKGRKVTFVYDITEKNKLEENLKTAKEKAEKASKYKSEFLANISHDIRTPLNAIIGFSEMILEKEDRNLEELDNIIAASKQLLNLVNDILDISRMDSKKEIIQKEDFIMKGVIDDVESMFRIQKKGAKFDFEIDLDEDFPYIVNTDRRRILQIISNLVGNAFKFTEKGEVKLSMKYKYDTGNIYISVKDTGIGISKKNREKIFETFEQEKNELSIKTNGVGLGLSIIKKLSNLMGGKVNLISEKGKGSEFIVEIPAKIIKKFPSTEVYNAQELIEKWIDNMGGEEELEDIIYEQIDRLPGEIKSIQKALEEKEMEKVKRKLHRISGSCGNLQMTELYEPLRDMYVRLLESEISFSEISDSMEEIYLMVKALKKHKKSRKVFKSNIDKNAKVLIVEDAYMNRKLLGTILKSEGVNYEFAENGKLALDMMSKKDYQLILLDSQMPVMDGYETLERIRKSSKFKNMHVIIITANILKSAREKYKELGCSEFLTKPIDRNDLLELIDKYIGKGRKDN
ncbi:MAG: CheR family methyltransferase [Fusobacteriota bacterium]